MVINQIQTNNNNVVDKSTWQTTTTTSKVYTSTVDYSQLVEPLRQRILDLIGQSDKKVDHQDMEKVQYDNNFVTRFIQEYYEDVAKSSVANVDLVKVAHSAIQCLHHRSSLNISGLTPADFPLEMYDARVFSGYEKPDDSRVFIFASASRLKTVPGFKETYANFCISVSQQIVTRLNGRRLHLVIDAAQISLSQIEPLVSLAYTLQCCFPGTIGSVSIVDLPFLLRTGLYVLLKIFPERFRNRIHIVSKSTIVEQIGLELLPDFFGGQGVDLEWTSDEKLRPTTAISIEDLGKQLGQSQSSCDRFRKSLVYNG